MKKLNLPTACSTWNTFLNTLVIVFAFIWLGCEKKDPKPELKDLIYQDMLAQQAEAEKIMADTKAKIEDVRKAAVDARPQTGLKQRAQRQIHDLEKLITKLQQQSVYWKLRTFERLKHVRLKAQKIEGPYQTDPEEWAAYNSEKKLRMAKNAWDIKDRFKETGFEYDPALLGEPASEPKKEAAPPAPAGGGH